MSDDLQVHIFHTGSGVTCMPGHACRSAAQLGSLHSSGSAPLLRAAAVEVPQEMEAPPLSLPRASLERRNTGYYLHNKYNIKVPLINMCGEGNVLAGCRYCIVWKNPPRRLASKRVEAQDELIRSIDLFLTP